MILSLGSILNDKIRTIYDILKHFDHHWLYHWRIIITVNKSDMINYIFQRLEYKKELTVCLSFSLSLSFLFSLFKTRAISLTGATDIHPHFETGRWWVGLIFWTNDRWITDRWVFYGGVLRWSNFMWSNGHEVEIVA